MSTIRVTEVSKSKIDTIDFDNLVFGRTFTDHMFIADYTEGQWHNFEIKPVAPLHLHPGNLALHYGQSIFEGMKATKHHDGRPLLFRPEQHSIRINASAHRMCMPAFPEDVFLEAIHKLVYLEKDWIPPSEGSALYLRPFMFATDEAIGVKPSLTYKFIICALPVGPYYDKPVRLLADTTYVRAAQGGVGEAKTAGNYAASLYPAKMAVEQGYDQVMWLDAKEFKYIQEVGTMNIFFNIDGTICTPETTGAILKGITRKSIIEILRKKDIKVDIRPITIDEICEAYDQGTLKEVFGTGTAAVIAKVEKIKYQEKVMDLKLGNDGVADLLKSTINGMRSGNLEDDFGWIVPVEG